MDIHQPSSACSYMTLSRAPHRSSVLTRWWPALFVFLVRPVREKPDIQDVCHANFWTFDLGLSCHEYDVRQLFINETVPVLCPVAGTHPVKNRLDEI